MQEDILLEVQSLNISFRTKRGMHPAVRGADFALHKGEVLGIVGESGCGKSVTSLSLMRLLADTAVIGEESHAWFHDEDLYHIPEARMEEIRGDKIAMIFQDPMTSLNPSMRIGIQVTEVIRTHRKADRRTAEMEALEILKRVGIPSPEKRMKEYPHQLSGGMKQRIMIAMALVCRPEILIADEPTTALDVTTQAQIVDLLKELKSEFDTSIVLITHDMGVVASIADRIAVMYCGEVVEADSARNVLKNPQHPYTKGLVSSIIRLGESRERLYSIQGSVPPHPEEITGCLFQDRCPCCEHRCRRAAPPVRERSGGGLLRCWLEGGYSPAETDPTGGEPEGYNLAEPEKLQSGTCGAMLTAGSDGYDLDRNAIGNDEKDRRREDDRKPAGS